VRFGSVSLDVLWAPEDLSDDDQNNHSVVLAATLGNMTFILSGDATAEVWLQIVKRLPARLQMFQVPHHGAQNGTFAPNGITSWLDHIVSIKPPVQAVLVVILDLSTIHIPPSSRLWPAQIRPLTLFAPTCIIM
jgi:hypothetical protein